MMRRTLKRAMTTACMALGLGASVGHLAVAGDNLVPVARCSEPEGMPGHSLLPPWLGRNAFSAEHYSLWTQARWDELAHHELRLRWWREQERLARSQKDQPLMMDSEIIMEESTEESTPILMPAPHANKLSPPPAPKPFNVADMVKTGPMTPTAAPLLSEPAPLGKVPATFVSSPKAGSSDTLAKWASEKVDDQKSQGKLPESVAKSEGTDDKEPVDTEPRVISRRVLSEKIVPPNTGFDKTSGKDLAKVKSSGSKSNVSKNTVSKSDKPRERRLFGFFRVGPKSQESITSFKAKDNDKGTETFTKFVDDEKTSSAKKSSENTTQFVSEKNTEDEGVKKSFAAPAKEKTAEKSKSKIETKTTQTKPTRRWRWFWEKNAPPEPRKSMAKSDSLNSKASEDLPNHEVAVDDGSLILPDGVASTSRPIGGTGDRIPTAGVGNKSGKAWWSNTSKPSEVTSADRAVPERRSSNAKSSRGRTIPQSVAANSSVRAGEIVGGDQQIAMFEDGGIPLILPGSESVSIRHGAQPPTTARVISSVPSGSPSSMPASMMAGRRVNERGEIIVSEVRLSDEEAMSMSNQPGGMGVPMTMPDNATGQGRATQSKPTGKTRSIFSGWGRGRPTNTPVHNGQNVYDMVDQRGGDLEVIEVR